MGGWTAWTWWTEWTDVRQTLPPTPTVIGVDYGLPKLILISIVHTVVVTYYINRLFCSSLPLVELGIGNGGTLHASVLRRRGGIRARVCGSGSAADRDLIFSD